MGKLGAAKRDVLVCRHLNLLKNKATVNLAVAENYRFTRKYPLFGGIRQ